jgi:DNA-binding NarL/FixJ family response regulator
MEQQIRVLIADDRHTTRQGLRALLTLLPQVEVIGEARDGDESVRMVSEHLPDVVLMDMQMPVMNGLEATRRIKTQWPEVRVIVLTMYDMYRAEALAAGADAFLLKDGVAESLAGTILAQVRNLSSQPTALQQRESPDRAFGTKDDRDDAKGEDTLVLVDW